MGAEEYFRSLLAALHRIRPSVDLYLAASPEVCQWARQFAGHVEGIAARAESTVIGRARHEQVHAPRIAKALKADAVFFPFNLAAPVPVASVLMVHDLVNRFYTRHYPWHRPIRNTFVRCAVARSIRIADQVVTPTRAVAEEIYGTGAKPRDRICAIHEAPIRRRISLRPGDDAHDDGGRIILLQGNNNNWHKCPATGIEAVRQLALLDPVLYDRVELVLTNVAPHLRSHLSGLVRRYRLEQSVRFCDRLSEEEYGRLVRRASLMIFPTIYEGFGLGIVEAQAEGKAVIASDIPVLREVSGGVAEFFAPRSGRELACAVHRLIRDPMRRRVLEEQGAKRASQHTWDDHAAALVRVLDDAIERRTENMKRAGERGLLKAG